jgi:hypothetical protein
MLLHQLAQHILSTYSNGQVLKQMADLERKAQSFR